jgi:hypothetical protein
MEEWKLQSGQEGAKWEEVPFSWFCWYQLESLGTFCGSCLCCCWPPWNICSKNPNCAFARERKRRVAERMERRIRAMAEFVISTLIVKV